MGKGWPHWLLPGLLALSTLGAAKPAKYWVCVGADGTKTAQDRACDDSQATLRQPPGTTSALPPPDIASEASPQNPQPKPLPSTSVREDSTRVAVPSPRDKPNPPASPFQPIIDVATKGFAYIALMIVAIFAFRIALARSGGQDRVRSEGAKLAPSLQTKSPWPERADPPELDRLLASQISPTSAVAAQSAPSWNLELLKAMDWKRFEELCQRYWTLKGFPAELTGPGADGGIDVRIADRQAPDRTFAIVQCKAWADQLVGVDKVRELWGSYAHFKASLAIFYGIAGFTEEARRFAEGKHLKLVDGPEFLRQILTLPAADQQSLLSHITRGDYTTPSCPQCESRLAINPKRPDYWSCPRFPKCRYQGLRVRKGKGPIVLGA